VTFYLAFDEVLLVHRILIGRFGGSHGLRDRGALESALARHQTGYYRDLIEFNAILAHYASRGTVLPAPVKFAIRDSRI
jgi:death-on-curing protein